MCGLVFAGGNLTSSDIDMVERMLIIDMFRGEHSTGVFSKFFPLNKDPVCKVVKAALAGDEFVRSEYWRDVACIEDRKPSTMTPGTDIVSRIFPKVVFGHNRYATKGAVNARNAHPFTHDHITLAHNGTLLNQSLLPESHRFEVDSDNVAYSVATIGIDETVKKLDGSFTLIWHDAKEQTVNILRNDEREFHLAELTNGDWFGMSEKWMLLGLLGRGRAPKKIKRNFEIEPGVQYVFDVSNGCKLKEERKHELPSFPAYSRTYSSRYVESSAWYDAYSASTASSGASSAKAGVQQASKGQTTLGYERYNEMMRKHGLHGVAVQDVIKAEFFQYDPYLTNPDRGMLVGWLPDEGNYIEVQVHAVEKSVWDGVDVEKYVQIVSCYEVNHVLTLIGRLVAAPVVSLPVCVKGSSGLDDEDELREIMEELEMEAGSEDSNPFLDGSYDPDLPEEEEFTASGHRFTREGWRKGRYCVCSNCASPIAFEDIQGAYIMDNPDACFCEACYTDIQEEIRLEMVQEEERAAEAAAAKPETFCCALCTSDVSLGDMSPREYVCNECNDHYYGKSDERIRIGNGWLVNQRTWEKMNECHYCHKSIPWSYAGLAKFRFENPVCAACERRYPAKK